MLLYHTVWGAWLEVFLNRRLKSNSHFITTVNSNFSFHHTLWFKHLNHSWNLYLPNTSMLSTGIHGYRLPTKLREGNVSQVSVILSMGEVKWGWVCLQWWPPGVTSRGWACPGFVQEGSVSHRGEGRYVHRGLSCSFFIPFLRCN